MLMQKRELKLQLNAPAFLGDAEQKGVWRTPPIKALLREWWRVAAAPAAGYRHEALREQEGVLFGNAWLEPLSDKKSRFCQSKVRLALAHWQEGKLTQHTPIGKVPHPEAERAGRMVEPLNYLGYGPIDKGQFKNGAALQAGEHNSLKLAWPESETIIPPVLQLIDWFGTFGGRSRNGWGSLGLGLEALSAKHLTLKNVLRPLNDCLQPDWPHAIGQDDKGALIWESKEAFPDWQAAMKFLAKTKIEFRTQDSIKFENGQPHPNERKRNNDWQLHRQPEKRHLLAYPITHHEVSKQRDRSDDRPDWGEGRLANQLRFKLFRDSQQKLRARIYHTPHACPLPAGAINQLAVWQGIHRWLDDPKNNLHRLGAAQ